MSASRLLMLTLVFAFGCKQLFSSSLADDSGKQALPHLYDKDYGTIEYTDTYTRLAASWGIEESQSVVNTFWAQEAVGTPEARALLAEMRKDGFAFSLPKLAIADNGFDLRQGGHPRLSYRLNETIRDRFDSEVIPFMQRSNERAAASDKYLSQLEEEGRIMSAASRQARGDGIQHGTNTLGIIAGEHPVGVSTHGVVHDLSSDAKQLASSLAEGKKSADVVNASLGYNSILEFKGVTDDTEEVKRWSTLEIADPQAERARLDGYQKFVDDIKKLPETTLWVNSAGNSFPHPLDDTKQQIKNKAILVGSADPSGFPSYFSQVDKSVVVLAPSDNYLQSIDAEGKLVNYGGTSGAAPMVSGVLADVKAILPNITRNEAAALLRVTATRTSINSVSTVNGAGMLNHYKMLRVAQRIADRLQQDSNVTIIRLLRDPKITRFHDETAKLYLEARRVAVSSNSFLRVVTTCN